MKRLNLSILIFFLIFFANCSDNNEVTEAESTVETTIEEQVEEIKEPDNNIWVSAKKGDIESIKQHIAFGTDLNSTGSRRDETALIISACQGHVKIVQLLVNEGVELDIQNDEGVTAQFCAVFFGQTDIVQLLNDAGADPNMMAEAARFNNELKENLGKNFAYRLAI